MTPIKDVSRLVALAVFLVSVFAALPPIALGQARPRARDLGIPLGGTPGPLNAITDVSGVEVGHSTIVEGEGPLRVGQGPARTGVTAILPRGRTFDPVFAGWYTLNGNGEMTGTTWVKESGFLETPILITNTFSVGVVRDAALAWMAEHHYYSPIEADFWFAYPLVAETWDGVLNDVLGFHVKKEHAVSALDTARSGSVAEGNVGGGTGMVCHEFKGGIGTSSRRVRVEDSDFTVGVLVQANHGGRPGFTVAGVPVGQEITDMMPVIRTGRPGQEQGSIIVVVATDAPLLPHQLERLAHRVPLGIGRVGGYGGNSSGDIFIAFSTANRGAFRRNGKSSPVMLSNDLIDPLFEATVEATEESILNVLVAAETTTGIDGNTVYALPHERLREVLKKYNRLRE